MTIRYGSAVCCALALALAIPAATAASLPFPWQHQDVGSVGVPGDAMLVSGSTFQVSGSGADIWGPADAFHFAYVPVTGDCEIISLNLALTNSGAATKAALMMRETLDPGARNILNALTFQDGIVMQSRPIPNGNYDYTQKPGVTAPVWLRLTRTGDVFRAFHSTNGTAWTLFGIATVPMGNTLYVGLAVTSGNNAALNTATFDSVTLRSGAATDSDGDGMPDAFEDAYGLNSHDPSDAGQDPDGDGMTNLQEYRAGTDPRDPASVLRIVDAALLSTNYVLRFKSVPDRSYVVERTTSLGPTNWTGVATVAAGTNTMLSVTNPVGAAFQSYYRVRIQP